MRQEGPAEAGHYRPVEAAQDRPAEVRHDGRAEAGRDNGGRARRRWTLLVTLLFVLLTAVMTWPQARFLATHARQHQDVFFNMWRLKWVAHALATNPAHFFDGNIFYPEPRTLTLSDAMLVEGLIGAPLFWIGLPSVLVHNLLLLGSIVASAVGIFVLARDLTGSRGAGLLAGIIFAFAPYRFEHYMHMELQWMVWTPWAFWAMHRTIASGRRRYGLLTGVFIGLQMLSSIYYGLFLATLLPLCGVLMLLGLRRGQFRRVVGGFAVGAVIAIAMCAVYAPYLRTKDERGGRRESELVTFSARPSSYLVSTPDNVMWGRSFASRGRLERRLFPGLTAVVLAIVGLLLRPPPRVALAYLLVMVVAFDMSLGLSGYTYRFLYYYVPGYQGLRALARLGIFVVFFLAVLAAYGYVAVARDLTRMWRAAIVCGLALVMLAEYRVRPLALTPYPNEPPPLYAWLAGQPRGVVAELPMRGEPLPGADPAYSYLSTFHWQPLVNGYSGFYPESYLSRLEAVRDFPDDRSMRRLRADGVRYLVIHLREYPAADREAIVNIVRNGYGLAELGRFVDGHGEAVVFALR